MIGIEMVQPVGVTPTASGRPEFWQPHTAQEHHDKGVCDEHLSAIPGEGISGEGT